MLLHGDESVFEQYQYHQGKGTNYQHCFCADFFIKQVASHHKYIIEQHFSEQHVPCVALGQKEYGDAKDNIQPSVYFPHQLYLKAKGARQDEIGPDKPKMIAKGCLGNIFARQYFQYVIPRVSCQSAFLECGSLLSKQTVNA